MDVAGDVFEKTKEAVTLETAKDVKGDVFDKAKELGGAAKDKAEDGRCSSRQG